jgi:2-hydroxyglutarate dehydrogenase
MADTGITIIGGGAVGLAIAAEVSRTRNSVILLERNQKCGQETSSRNSEVIHAGMYYPAGTLKARLCVEGNVMLYDLCGRHGIPHKRITKIITATRKEEIPELERLMALGHKNGADLRMITGEEALAMEPMIVSVAALYSPNTGIISAHGLMDFFQHQAMEQGVTIQTRCSVVGLERKNGEYAITIQEGDERSTFTSEAVINAAGLDSDTIAGLAGVDIDAAHYRLHYSRGCYFTLPASLSRCVSRLVYPVPTKESLGVHAVVDLGGRVKFGPDSDYLSERKQDYRVDPEKRSRFAASIRRILPHVADDDITPDMSGIRPKLQPEGGAFRDFIIREESDRGLPGLINLVGIESPGLTSSPAIARMVNGML